MAKKILIAEDDKLLSDMLQIRLTSEGFTVLHASNGEDALKIAHVEHPDLMLLDMVMPVMDGVTTLKKLRETEEGRRTKVIVLSNLSDSEKVEKAIAEGVHDYLVKTDWHLDDLMKKIREKLSE